MGGRLTSHKNPNVFQVFSCGEKHLKKNEDRLRWITLFNSTLPSLRVLLSDPMSCRESSSDTKKVTTKKESRLPGRETITCSASFALNWHLKSSSKEMV